MPARRRGSSGTSHANSGSSTNAAPRMSATTPASSTPARRTTIACCDCIASHLFGWCNDNHKPAAAAVRKSVRFQAVEIAMSWLPQALGGPVLAWELKRSAQRALRRWLVLAYGAWLLVQAVPLFRAILSVSRDLPLNPQA